MREFSIVPVDHEDPPTGEALARRWGNPDQYGKPVTIPGIVGEWVVRFMPWQEDDPSVTARVTFDAKAHPDTGARISGSFEANDEPLIIRLLDPSELQ